MGRGCVCVCAHARACKHVSLMHTHLETWPVEALAGICLQPHRTEGHSPRSRSLLEQAELVSLAW